MTYLGDAENLVRVRRVIHLVKLASSAFDRVCYDACAEDWKTTFIIKRIHFLLLAAQFD